MRGTTFKGQAGGNTNRLNLRSESIRLELEENSMRNRHFCLWSWNGCPKVESAGKNVEKDKDEERCRCALFRQHGVCVCVCVCDWRLTD